MSKNEDVIAIVLNYNDADTVTNYLKLNEGSSKQIKKIIIVDNSSTDDSFATLTKYNSSFIDVIKTNYNGGYAYGNNYGIKYAIEKYNPKYILISNPDVTYSIETILNMKSALQHNHNIAQVAPILMGDNIRVQNTAWKLPTMKSSIKEIFFPTTEKQMVSYIESCKKDKLGTYVDVISGAFFMVRTSVMEQVDFFDEKTFLYGEENILAHKIKSIGYKNLLLHNYYYEHLESISIKKSIKSERKRMYILLESTAIYQKFYLKKNVILRTLYNLLWIMMYNLRYIIKKSFKKL